MKFILAVLIVIMIQGFTVEKTTVTTALASKCLVYEDRTIHQFIITTNQNIDKLVEIKKPTCVVYECSIYKFNGTTFDFKEVATQSNKCLNPNIFF